MPSRSRLVTLALSGGNALGAYTAGACQGLLEEGFTPDLVAGASIGAITAALLAGNAPADRVDRLRDFWRQAASGPSTVRPWMGERAREVHNKLHAMRALLWGRPGLFAPRASGFLSLMPGTPPDIALFDARPLVSTLERLIDFDRIAAGELPIVLATVDILTGEAVYFDSRRERITPRHLLASTAFIPGFPPVEIGGRLLGDPGLVCNLPLDPLLGGAIARDQLCFAVDLYDARGPAPVSIDTAVERAQDLSFGTQSLRTIEALRQMQRLRHLAAAGAASARSGAANADGLDAHERAVARARMELALIAYRPPAHELGAKGVEYSQASLDERWHRGRRDMADAIGLVRTGRAARRDPGFTFYDGRVGPDVVAEAADANAEAA